MNITLAACSVLLLACSSFSQNASGSANVAKDAIASATRYCEEIEAFTHASPARFFAKPKPEPAGATESWQPLAGEEAWKRAGKPMPFAAVWYRDKSLVSAKIASKDARYGISRYDEYCFRPDGKLLIARSIPSLTSRCDDLNFRCDLMLGSEWIMSPDSHDARGDKSLLVTGSDMRPLKSERTLEIQTTPPPLYRSVSELPFSKLLESAP
jgi:hypothetical protein